MYIHLTDYCIIRRTKNLENVTTAFADKAYFLFLVVKKVLKKSSNTSQNHCIQPRIIKEVLV